jgi:Zn finger protein HypA/HybF involved in hydrogenase expression
MRTKSVWELDCDNCGEHIISEMPLFHCPKCWVLIEIRSGKE